MYEPVHDARPALSAAPSQSDQAGGITAPNAKVPPGIGTPAPCHPARRVSKRYYYSLYYELTLALWNELRFSKLGHRRHQQSDGGIVDDVDGEMSA